MSKFKSAPQTERETRNETGLKKVQRPRPETMRAPRPWEPIPLHVPVPEPPRNRDDRGPIIEKISTPRGVVIIDYGDGE